MRILEKISGAIKFSFAYFIIGTLLCSCGLFSRNDAPGPLSGQSVCDATINPINLNAFKSTIQPILQKSCYECHNSVSPKAPSAFADDSPSIGYRFARQFADFRMPSNSIFIRRMNEQHNCESDCQNLANQFKNEIASWSLQEVETTPSSAPKSECTIGDPDDAKVYQSTAQAIATTLDLNETKLTFDLKDASPSLPGAIFEVTVKRFTTASALDMGSYVLSNPTLAIPPQSSNAKLNVRVTSLAILFDGAQKPDYRNWLGTDFVIKPRTFSTTIGISGWYAVNDATEIINWVAAPGDNISFRLRVAVTNANPTVPTINPFECKNLGTFNQFYDQIKSTCLGCHAGNNATAFAKFPQSANATVTCQEFKRRANLNVPLQSLAWLMPQNMVPGRIHPITYPFTSNDQTNITNWINSEK